MTKKELSHKRTHRVWIAAFFLNAVAVLILVGFFSPHWLPFLQKEVRGQVVIPAHIAPVDGDLTENGTVIEAGKPVRIVVPSVGIDLAVVDGVYDQRTGDWTLSKDKAHYAAITPYANNVKGNTFIYGHNRRGVFAPLIRTVIGDKAYVYTDNHKVFTYVLREFKDVEPSDVGIFAYEGDPILTLQTCSGTWYEDRRLFTFDFVSVEEQQ